MKGFKIYGFIATLAAFAVCASAFAQDGPPPQGDRGGPPPDMQQGRGPGMRMGRPLEPLLMRSDVQKELKLSDEQIKKLRPLFRPIDRGPEGGPDRMGDPGRGQDGPGGPPPRGDDRGGPPNGDRGGRPGGDMGGPPNGADRMGPEGGGPREMDGKLQEILSDGQFKRLKELQLQRMGAEALSRKELADKLGLSDEERERVRGIIEEARENMPRPEPGDQMDREKMRKAHQEMVAKLNEKVFKVLTAKERSKWDELTGKPFKFDENWEGRMKDEGGRP